MRESMSALLLNLTRIWPPAKSLAAFVPVVLALTVPACARPPFYLADPVTAYAIGGYDPVAYFVDGYPRPGDRKIELIWQGVRWLFVNEGNKAAFERDPEVYAPQYGGCGAYALVEGYATAGNPAIFALLDNRLYFFHTAVNRYLFLTSRKTSIEEAAANAVKTGCLKP
jgi:hypothetical protein